MSALLRKLKPADAPLEEIERINNKYDAYAFLRHYTRDCGYAFFTVMTLIPETGERSADSLLMSNLPESLVSDMDSGRLFARSSTLAAVRKSVAPVVWELGKAVASRPDDERVRILAILGRHEIRCGVALPVHDHAGHRGIVIFFGDREPPDFALLAQMMVVAGSFFDQLAKLEPIGGARPAKLSERERQCLVWTAAGKTSAEIAVILGLSEHTINQYIGACCQKLGAVNRTHAVAQAIRLQLIA